MAEPKVPVPSAGYIFEKNEEDQELKRLRLIEQALDEESIARLRTTGLEIGWRCLELGAGAGLIAQWMAGIVGDRGQVVAVDSNTIHIQHLTRPPCKIVQGDFLDLSIQGEFDLAHCRYVLIHNQQSQSMLKKLCGLLKPGGYREVRRKRKPHWLLGDLLFHSICNCYEVKQHKAEDKSPPKKSSKFRPAFHPNLQLLPGALPVLSLVHTRRVNSNA